ncbi:MAG: glutamate racemase [Pseudomonadota bacterium]
MTILVFDSGIGGLTVLREARVLMPDHRFIYVADNAGFPYGDWAEDALVGHIVATFEILLSRYQPDLVIIACNTASTLILPALRERFDVPFVGTVPAIKPAAERTSSGQVSVLATPGTVQRDYTRALISEYASMVNVRLVGATKLAALSEAHMQGQVVDRDTVWSEISQCFVDRLGARTDIVVLACTHYPFLANVFRKIAPWPVDWLDPAEAIARHALSLLRNVAPRPGETEDHDQALLTGEPPNPALARLLSGFGLHIEVR